MAMNDMLDSDPAKKNKPGAREAESLQAEKPK